MFSPSSSSYDHRPTGIGIFHGDSVIDVQSQLPSNSPRSSSKDSPAAVETHTTDTLEFAEFLAKNSVKIIDPKEFTFDDSASPTDGHSEQATHSTPRIENPVDVELKGANMKVLRAHRKGKPVALKVFRKTSVPTLGSTASDLAQKFSDYTNLMHDLRYEIQVMNQWGLNPHRNIVHLIGISFEESTSATCESNSQRPIKMERCLRPILVTPLAHRTYPDLRHYLRHHDRPRPLPWDDCVRLIGDIADGVHGLNHVGVIHADLKPENILIFPNEHPDIYKGSIVAKVSDFGFSGLKINESAPRGSTRVWNAPECLPGCADEQLRVYGDKANRDISSFGLVMVHIMMDGGEPLPFEDLEALDKLKLRDKAREEARRRLRGYYEKYRKHAEAYELERLETLIEETLQLVPGKRRDKLDGVRSYLVGKEVYPRELEIIRMTRGNRFPALAAIKHSDLLHQAAATIPAVQASLKKLPHSLKVSIVQYYLLQDIAMLPWITKMRLLGLATQEIRDSVVADPKETAEVQILRKLETELLQKYEEYRTPTARIRSYIKEFLPDFHRFQDGSEPEFLRDLRLGMNLEGYILDEESEEFPELFVRARTKGGWGALHYAAYFDRYNAIPQLLHSGLLVDDRAGMASYTPLHLAAMQANISSIQTLLDHCANVNSVSLGELGCTFTPLSLCVWHQSPRAVEVVNVLLSSGAVLSTMGGRVSLAHIAAGRNSVDILSAILGHAPELLNARDAYHRTPLHIAAEEGMVKNVQLLLDLGANPGLRDYEEKTPLELVNNRRKKAKAKGDDTGIEGDAGYKLLTRNRSTPINLDGNTNTILHLIETAIKLTTPQPSPTFPHFQKLIRLPPKPPTPDPANRPRKQKRGGIPLYEAQETSSSSYIYKGLHLSAAEDYPHKFAVSIANTIPRMWRCELFLPDALLIKSRPYDVMRKYYVVLEPRYGLRFIWHVMNDVPAGEWQLLLRLGRLYHKWNDFEMMLEVKIVKDVKKELLFQHRWQTAHCLPEEHTIYTLKFGEFQLCETADIEISLSTVNIGSTALPTAGLALNWIAIEPITPEVPVYGIFDVTDIEQELEEWDVRPDGLDDEPLEYGQADEGNADEMGQVSYYG